MISYIKYISLFLALITSHYVIGNTINAEELKKEIFTYNEYGQYDKSILKLDAIIHSDNVSNYNLYQLYLLKYLTYKTILNYPEAEENLNKAEKYGLLDPNHKAEVKERVAIERIFIEFDYKRHENVEKLVKEINVDNLKYLDPETYSFYISVLGTIEMNHNNYAKAEEYYFKAINVLQEKSPAHLPNIYRKLIHLYTITNNTDKVFYYFNKGLENAKKYNMKLYILNLHESLTWHYEQKENWEKAYKTRLIVNDLATDYDAINQNGKLIGLEKEILFKRNDLERRNQKNIRIFLSIISAILIILLVVIFKFYKINKEKRVLVELENERMREKLSDLINGQKNQPTKEINLSNYNLSERQLEIIELVKKGLTNKEIAAQLFISENTVKYHLKIVYTTLGIESRNAL